jgi:acyl-homoserine lactone acylase PvdQ
MLRAVLAAAVVGLVTAGPVPAAERDFAATALNIMPSGQLGSFPPPAGADRQARMYDALTPKFDQVTTRDLTRDFKPAPFGTRGQCPCRVERVPRRGVRIVRDRFDVPHITATRADDLTWAAGWVTAADRALLLEALRSAARVAAIDAPGLSALDLLRSQRAFVPSDQTETEITRQTRALRATGLKGRRVLHDIDVYVAGINAQLRRAGSSAKPWARNDVYAANALKGELFGQGGGDEARRSAFLSALQAQLGPQSGQLVFDDLRQRDAADHRASIPGSFPYAEVPASKAGSVVVDAGSLQPWGYGPDGGAPGAPTAPTAAAASPATAAAPQASNVIMLAAQRSTNGHPLFVGGPQIGYSYPGLMLEMDLHGPGVDVRGATAPGFPGYLLIGRGPDFAWTLTSAGGDIVDQFAETLCGGDDTHYTYRGQCRAMTRFDAGVVRGAGGQPDQRVTFLRTVHGPVVGYATTEGGRRIALASKRSTYGRDVVDQLAFQDLTLGRVGSPQEFVSAMLQSPQTFNAFYADDRQIAAVTTGQLPVRAPDVDPGLPTNGDGAHEWRGFLSDGRHPQRVNPPSGRIINWNNKMARGFNAADNAWNYGLSHRVNLLFHDLLGRGRHTLASVTGAMNAAATQDVRAMDVVPTLARVLRGAPAPSPRATQMLDLLEAWRKNGGSRLDRDGDGRIDDPGAAIMDAAWPRLSDAALSPVLGAQVEALAALEPRFDQPPGGQARGWHSYMVKDLRALLGDKLLAPFRVRYCGAGNLGACQTALWATLDAVGAQLALSQGPDPAAWRADANAERITFVPGILPTTLRYTNRPSGIQQVMSFKGHRAGR